MAHEIEGKFLEAGGIEKVGEKQIEKRTFAITYASGQYENTLAFDLWKDKCGLVDGIQTGALVQVKFDVKSREYNGKWYTNAVAWSVKEAQGDVPLETLLEDDNGPVDDDNLPF